MNGSLQLLEYPGDIVPCLQEMRKERGRKTIAAPPIILVSQSKLSAEALPIWSDWD